MRRLDDRTWVAGQVLPEQMAALAEAGVARVVNNRPDGEEPGQPTSAEIEAAGCATGMTPAVTIRGAPRRVAHQSTQGCQAAC